MHTFSTLGTAAALLALATLPAAATVTKTWVSSTGTDSGTCQLVAPCKTFQFAHDQTSPGGEIDVKDTGSYGGLTITKAISIVSGDGALAALGASQGGTAITVNAGPSDVVILQGLVIDGHGLGKFGVDVVSAGGLIVENCKIRNVTSEGIDIEVNLPYFNIIDTEVSGSYFGILISPSSLIHGSISKVNVFNNQVGIGISHANVSIIDSKITGNFNGIQTTNSGNALIGQSTIAENTNDGVVNSGGTLNSYGDNYINANGTDIAGSISSIPRR